MVLAGVTPMLAQAQGMPSYATPDTAPQNQPPPPPNAPPPSYAHQDQVISGRISSIPGKYDIEIRDANGYIDRVRLIDGTVINPTGLRLAVGMSVQVHGVNIGQVFQANEIDSPYQMYGYAYGPYAAAYPVYPYWGYAGYPYWGWGGIGIGIGIGWSGYYGGWRGYYGGWRGGWGGWGYGYHGGWGGYRGWR